jgi:predicted secreted hydrolase
LKRSFSLTIGVVSLIALALGLRLVWQREPPPPPRKLDIAAVIAQGAEGHARAEGHWRLVFPRDHGAHPEFRSEVWSLKGHLQDDQGRYLGLQLILLRLALMPGEPQRASAWAANQLYAARLALTGPSDNGFAAAERSSRAALGLAGAGTDPVRVWVEEWSLAVDADGRLRLTAGADGARFVLEMEPTKPVLDPGGIDLAGFGPNAGGGLHFYLIPRLRVSGIWERGGEPRQVSGIAWLDRAWGAVPVPRGQVATDRFSVQLDDGRDLLCLRLRRQDGSGTPVSSCRLIGSDGTVNVLRRRDVRLEPLGFWTSPEDAVEYPVVWRLQVGPLGLDLSLRPEVEEQELIWPLRVWSGALRIDGQANGEPITGRGFAELAGYGAPGRGRGN